MRTKKIIKFYNETTNIENCQLLLMMAKQILQGPQQQGEM